MRTPTRMAPIWSRSKATPDAKSVYGLCTPGVRRLHASHSQNPSKCWGFSFASRDAPSRNARSRCAASGFGGQGLVAAQASLPRHSRHVSQMMVASSRLSANSTGEWVWVQRSICSTMKPEKTTIPSG